MAIASAIMDVRSGAGASSRRGFGDDEALERSPEVPPVPTNRHQMRSPPRRPWGRTAASAAHSRGAPRPASALASSAMPGLWPTSSSVCALAGAARTTFSDLARLGEIKPRLQPRLRRLRETLSTQAPASRACGASRRRARDRAQVHVRAGNARRAPHRRGPAPSAPAHGREGPARGPPWRDA